MRTLRACLHDEPLPRVIALGDLWDAPLSATTPRDVVESLASHMLVERHALDAKAALPEEARAALEAVIAAGGKMPLAGFERRFGSIRPMGPGKLERERPWLAPANIAETLWYHGFIFRAFDKTPRAPVEMAFVPNDLRALITPAEPEVTFNDDRRKTTDDKDASSVVHRPSSLLDDVTTILCHIQNGEVKVRANGDWDAASRNALLPMLRNDDAERLALLLHLIETLGWTRASEGRLRLIPQAVTQWLQSRPDAQRDLLFNIWLDDAEWNDLAHVPGLSLQMTHAWSNNPVRERRAIVEMWEKWRVESEEWRSERDNPLFTLHSPLSTFIAHVKTTNPDFARSDGRYDTWHVRNEASGDFLHGFEHWDDVEGVLIRYIIERPLAWLSFDAPAQTSSPESPEKPFALSNDGRVTIAGVLRFERFQLARVADWQETAGAQFTYLITAKSLARAREQGIRSQRVLEFLEQSSGQPAPAALAKSITRWSERGVEARMEPLVILKTQDGAMMETLLKINEIRRAVVDRFAPNCISIRERDAEAVRSAMVNAGVMADLI